RRARAPPQHRLRISGGTPVPASERCREPRLWPPHARACVRRRRNGAHREFARHRALARSATGEALGWGAPARRLPPRAADAPPARAPRRAARLARRGEEARDFALSTEAARRGARAHGLCQPPRAGAQTHRDLGGAARRRARGRRRRPRLARRGDGGTDGVVNPARSRLASARGHALVLKLLDRALVLRQMGEPHAAQHVRRLGELDVVVADDLYPVAPGVAEIEEPTRQRLDARRRQRAAHRVLVVDHETEMAAVVGALDAALLQREKLIAQIDERRGLALAAQFELEQASVERQRLLDIADLDSDMVETDGALFPCFRHETSPTIRAVIMW